MLANYVDSMFIHSFYDPSNFVAEFFQNALIEFVQTLPQPRQLREVQAPPRGGGGTLGISGWGCAAGSLEPLTFTRASSAEFCYPILE